MFLESVFYASTWNKHQPSLLPLTASPHCTSWLGPGDQRSFDRAAPAPFARRTAAMLCRWLPFSTGL